jgi:phosphoglycolate phosphatase-like HAD superfamily hydrolase
MKVLVDLDGTLLDFKTGEKNAFKDTIKKFTGHIVNNEEINKFSEINEYYFNEYKNGK